MTERRWEFVRGLVRIALGLVLIVAGGLKITNLPASAFAVRAYQLLPYDLAGYVGYALPAIEIIVGLLLVLGAFTRVAAALSALLIVAFIIGIVWAWAQGLSIDCGCFGGGGSIEPGRTAYPLELGRDLLMLGASLWLVRAPRSAFALDDRF